MDEVPIPRVVDIHELLQMVQCHGCKHFQRSGPESAIGMCARYKVEVLERYLRYCDGREPIERPARKRK